VAEVDRDRLRRLTERLDVAAQRAERLLSESVLAAATAPPPDHLPPDHSPPDHPPSDHPASDHPPPAHPSSDRDPARSEPDTTHARPSGPDGDPLQVVGGDPQPPPPSGWRQPRPDDRSDRDRWLDSDELELLLTVLAGIRDRIPPDLRRRLADAVRELLMALRAVIDWYLERSDRPAHTSADVEDIPIL
jgi:hypothetical protein